MSVPTANLIAHLKSENNWTDEQGLLTPSIQTNTFSNVIKKYDAYSALFTKASSQYYQSNENIGIVGNNSFTISTWVYLLSNSSNVAGVLSFGAISAKRLVAIVPWYSTGQQWAVWTAAGADPDNAISGIVPTLSAWQHIGVTYDGTTLKLYLNGNITPIATATVALNISASALTIGRTILPSYIDGYTDQTRIYSDAKTASEINDLYTEFDGPAPNGLTYSPQNPEYFDSRSIDPNVPALAVGTEITYSINTGSLPDGLSLATDTGIITGTPVIEQPETPVTIRATNASGFASSVLNITVSTIGVPVPSPSETHKKITDGTLIKWFRDLLINNTGVGAKVYAWRKTPSREEDVPFINIVLNRNSITRADEGSRAAGLNERTLAVVLVVKGDDEEIADSDDAWHIEQLDNLEAEVLNILDYDICPPNPPDVNRILKVSLTETVTETEEKEVFYGKRFLMFTIWTKDKPVSN